MTRAAILTTAREMFAERGYDNVTIVEIADAVNLSAKTVFVHFRSKEDLVFDGETEMRERIVARVRDRAVGQTPLDAMAQVIGEMVRESGSRAVQELDQLYRMIGDNLTLQARMRLLWERCEHALAHQLAEETGEPPTAPRPRIVAAQLILILRLLASEDVLSYLRTHPEPEQRTALWTWLDDSLETVGNGIQDYGRRAGAGS
jgi:AcrR family transcriptional regulator